MSRYRVRGPDRQRDCESWTRQAVGPRTGISAHTLQRRVWYTSHSDSHPKWIESQPCRLLWYEPKDTWATPNLASETSPEIARTLKKHRSAKTNNNSHQNKIRSVYMSMQLAISSQQHSRFFSIAHESNSNSFLRGEPNLEQNTLYLPLR